ncbi:MAG TPA: hypothetical protein VMG12_03545 [Polyangiaceae bacterium]|nr:hypothetical protein [Polyangiaceae bacterium]
MKHCTSLALCAALISACSDSKNSDDSMPAEDGTETNVRMVQPAEGSAGTTGAGAPMSPPTTPPGDSFPGEACDGCARFFLPITGENQRGDFELPLAAPVDMTGATLTFRLMANAFAGNAGGVSVYVRDAGNFDKGFVWRNLTALAAWTDVVVNFSDSTLAGNPSFDITRVAKVGVQLNSAGTFAGANWQDATVYLDAVHFSNAPTADLAFSDGIGAFTLVTPEAPAGTSVGFIAP